MDKLIGRIQKYSWKDISKDELVYSGHLACAGCGAALAMRIALKALGKDIVIIVPASCWSVIDGIYPFHALKVNFIHTAFETAPSVATGLKRGLIMKGEKKKTVVSWAGDGATFDIGLQALSSAAERNEDIIYICYDNEGYMNTGSQSSSSTPYGATTGTTPATFSRENRKKDIIGIMAAHQIPYIATSSVAFPEDMTRKIIRAKQIKGFRFLHILSPCPVGWGFDSELTVEIARLAVETRLFPLIEIYKGIELCITYEPSGESIRKYLRLQKRFSHLKDKDIRMIQKTVNRNWENLIRNVSIWKKKTEDP